ncbi:Microtubule binding protein [Colletotrichum higginsianum IMI 349063]|uniref:Microtubule binding protein n=1 Tax=Colletotrichum higginsianum (strain IMI 349063) TaxID=759273 RepID=A0A1B7XV17_COLHI|nr:Microtubule binding protein [Colletotrichum higginsianum IMI 349063]OBR03583.1 Microtubule binding protein [Colletotrichum higginsianum IMI 349063]
MPYSESAQAALVQWANTFPLDKKADSISDFLDGHLLSQVLQDLDPSFDSNTSEGELYDVYKGITRLVYRECPGLIRQTKLADIRPRAREAQPEAISKLLAVLFAIAMLGSNNARYVTRITQDITDKTNLMQLQRVTQEMKVAIDEAEAQDLEEASEPGHESHDADLAMEADNIRLRSDLDKKGKLLADMETRLGHLQESYDDLKEEVVRKGRELEAFHSAQDGAGKEVIRSLELKLREQDELIANQEAQAEDDRITKERLTSEVSALKAKTQKLETLDDEVKELRFKNEELSRKANMVERYKQKLEAQSTLSKEMDNLLYEKEQMQRDLIEYEKVLKRNQALEQTNEQYASKLRDYELQYVELDAQRRALHDDTQQLRARLATLDAQRLSDERLIADLQEQINSGSQAALSPDAGTAGFSLEEELEGAGGSTAPNPALEISRLKAENNLLRSGMGSASENARLRQELEEERKQRERIQKTYNETFEKQQLAEAQVSALIESSGEKLVELVDEAIRRGLNRVLTQDYYYSEVLGNLRVQIDQKTLELERERRRLNEVQAQLADKDRELLSARTDLSAVAKDSVEALEELKSTDQLISGSIREELDAARQQLKNLGTDLEEQRSSLINALLEKDKLRKDLDEAREARQDGTEPAELVQKLQDKIEKLRVRLKERTSQLEKSEQDKYEFQRKLKAAEGGEAAAAQKAASDQIIKNLQRENALIATAWYDLTSRIQSNHVVLQRRSEMPKSWLGKQRQMVNGLGRLMGGNCSYSQEMK